MTDAGETALLTAECPYEIDAAAIPLRPKRDVLAVGRPRRCRIAPKVIAVMDITSAKPQVRDRLRRLDAFTVEGNGVIYLVDGSELLRGAQQGSAFHRAALAAVIWHEMAHLDGADEGGAREAESALWASFVRDGRIDQLTGLRYLSALERRRDDRLLASR
jgi:hypothetical protein